MILSKLFKNKSATAVLMALSFVLSLSLILPAANAVEFSDDMFIRVGLYYGESTAGFYKMTSDTGFDIVEFDEVTQEYTVTKHISSFGGTCSSVGTVVSAVFDNGETASGEKLYIAAADFDSDERPVISVPSGKKFHGILRFTAQNSRLTVVNVLRLEDYIKGVLPNEVVPSWEHECLKTSAVAARTFALSTLNGKHNSLGFDVCNTICCQVYVGAGTETEATNLAIDETLSEILVYDGKIISAVYHSSSGGCTESAAGAWGGSEETHPYLTVVETPFEKYEEYPNGSWTYDTTAKELYEYINSKGAYSGKLRETIERIEYTPGPSGYVREVTLYDPYGNNFTVKTSSNVFSLFSKFVKSANFTITTDQNNKSNATHETASQTPVTVSAKVYVLTASGLKSFVLSGETSVVTASGIDSIGTTATPEEKSEIITGKQSILLGKGPVTFNGKGFGHGVGLSQFGSRELAKLGKTYDEILGTYYPGAVLTNIGSLAHNEEE